jgi:hypothetical protein
MHLLFQTILYNIYAIIQKTQEMCVIIIVYFEYLPCKKKNVGLFLLCSSSLFFLCVCFIFFTTQVHCSLKFQLK